MNEKLPPILRAASADVQSPFRYPSDEEVFLFRENDRLRQNQEGVHIWDKKTASNRTQLKHFKNYDVDNTESSAKMAFNEKERRIIGDALQIVKDRQKQREKGKEKESIVKLLEQKKEIFLVSKAHGIIEEEIAKLLQTKEEKQQALEQSNQMLEKDKDNFNKYVETSKQQKLDAELKAENEMKEKKAKEAEIKSITIKMTSLRAEKRRNEEAVNNFNDHKKFLDKLAPKEFMELKEKRRQQLIQKLKVEYLKKGTEKQFQTLLETKKIDELEDFDDEYEMYFKTPSQLVDIFNDLEERNLFLISTTQESEQKLEELKTKFKKIKQQLDEKIKSLQQNREALRQQFDQASMQIKTLKAIGVQKDVKKDNKELKKQITDLYEIFSNDIQGMHDIQSKDTLEILVPIELYLEKQLKQIRAFKPDIVGSYYSKFVQEGKAKSREESNARKQQQEEEKIKKNKEKIMQPSKKKEGRQPMPRSHPFDKVQEEKEDSVNNEELEDQNIIIITNVGLKITDKNNQRLYDPVLTPKCKHRSSSNRIYNKDFECPFCGSICREEQQIVDHHFKEILNQIHKSASYVNVIQGLVFGYSHIKDLQASFQNEQVQASIANLPLEDGLESDNLECLLSHQRITLPALGPLCKHSRAYEFLILKKYKGWCKVYDCQQWFDENTKLHIPKQLLTQLNTTHPLLLNFQLQVLYNTISLEVTQRLSRYIFRSKTLPEQQLQNELLHSVFDSHYQGMRTLFFGWTLCCKRHIDLIFVINHFHDFKGHNCDRIVYYSCVFCNRQFTEKPVANMLDLTKYIIFNAALSRYIQMKQNHKGFYDHKYELEQYFKNTQLLTKQELFDIYDQEGLSSVTFKILCPISKEFLQFPLLLKSCPAHTHISFNGFFAKYYENNFKLKGLILCPCEVCRNVQCNEIEDLLVFNSLLNEILEKENYKRYLNRNEIKIVIQAEDGIRDYALVKQSSIRIVGQQ